MTEVEVERQIGSVLLVEDDTDLQDALCQGLELAGFSVTACASADAALPLVSRDANIAIVTDIRMPGMDGMAFLDRCLEIDPALSVLLMTGHGDVPLAVEAMKKGAWDFLEKPFGATQLVPSMTRALEKRRLVLENRVLRAQLSMSTGLDEKLVGKSPAMQTLRNQILAVAPTDADVLVMGETGSGKEVVARALHDFGQRKDKPFVALNCGALPADIIESELFGHEQGAFTGAHKKRVGKLEHANGGTVFLDEIESMSPDLQVKLLRVIETRSLERLGSNQILPLDIRFVAASKADLLQLSNEGKFRADLFFRLNVVTLQIPALRERREDIPDLFWHLAREARARYRKEIPEAGAVLVDDLCSRDWPGNVRELRNEADRFVLGMPVSNVPALNGSAENKLSDRVANFEKSLIQAELDKAGGRIKDVYESMGLSRKGLYDKMKKYGLKGGE